MRGEPPEAGPASGPAVPFSTSRTCLVEWAGRPSEVGDCRARRTRMTEAEWLECNDPIPMLSYLQADGNGRKTLLFIVACMVRIWDRIAEQGHEWVEAAEMVAEGKLNRRKLEYHYDEVGESALEHAYFVGSP